MIDELKYENNRLNLMLSEKERELDSTRIKLKAMDPKKKSFDKTKQLITKLEEVEHMTRSRGISRNHSRSTLGKSGRNKRVDVERELTFYD